MKFVSVDGNWYELEETFLSLEKMEVENIPKGGFDTQYRACLFAKFYERMIYGPPRSSLELAAKDIQTKEITLSEAK